MPDSPFGAPEDLSPIGDEVPPPADPNKYVPPRGFRPENANRRTTATPTPEAYTPPATISGTSTTPADTTPTAAAAVPARAPESSTPVVKPPPTVAPPTATDATPATPEAPTGSPHEQYASAFAPRENAEAFEPAVSTATRKRGRHILAGVGVLAVVGGVAAGGLFAYAKLSGGGVQPADVITGQASAYVRLDLDPSLSQKINIAKVVKQQTGAAKITDNSDLPSLVTEALNLDQCGLTYIQDVKPWIGQRFAAAAVPGDGGHLSPLIAIQTTDEKKAAATMSSLTSCDALNGSASTIGNGYVIITDKGQAATTADQVLKGEAPTLAKNATYDATTDALGDQGFASFWVNPTPVLEEAQKAFATYTSSNSRQPQAKPITTPVKSIAGVLRASGSGVEMSIHIKYAPGKTPKPDKVSAALANVPADGEWVAALPGVDATTVDKEAATADPQSLADQFSGAGLTTPSADDVDGVTKIIDTVFINPTVLTGGGFTGDDGTGEEWAALLTDVTQAKVRTMLDSQDLIPSAMVTLGETNGHTLIGSDAKVPSRFTSTTDIIDTAGFKTTVGDWSNSAAIGYVNVDAFDKDSAVKQIGFNVANPKGNSQTITVKTVLR